MCRDDEKEGMNSSIHLTSPAEVRYKIKRLREKEQKE